MVLFRVQKQRKTKTKVDSIHFISNSFHIVFFYSNLILICVEYLYIISICFLAKEILFHLKQSPFKFVNLELLKMKFNIRNEERDLS